MLFKKKNPNEVTLTGENTYEQQMAWYEYGIKMKWVGPVTCDTHEGFGLTEAEEQEFEHGGDPCIRAMRVFDNPEEFDEVYSTLLPLK